MDGQILWEFPMYFEDMAGHRDSLTFVVAEGAQENGEDPDFGEVQIQEPWDKTFEVRIMQGWNSNDSYELIKGYKRQVISADNYLENNFVLSSTLLFNNFVDSVKVEYDSSLINEYNFRNFIYDRARVTRTFEDDNWDSAWGIETTELNFPHAIPVIRCLRLMNSFTETFNYHTVSDSIHDSIEGWAGYTVQQRDNSVGMAFACDLIAYVPWNGNGYCDPPNFIENPLADLFQPIIFNNKIKDGLLRWSWVSDIEPHDLEWRLVDSRAIENLRGDLTLSGEVNVSHLPTGLYYFVIGQKEAVYPIVVIN